MAEVYNFKKFVSNSELDERNRQALEREERIEASSQDSMFLSSLAGHVRKCWDAAHYAKNQIEADMIESQRQRKGEYDPTLLARIKQFGGSEIFMQVTGTKCRAAESWLRDILLNAPEPPWDIEPTPMPDLPPMIQQEIDDTVMMRVQEFIMGAGVQPEPHIVANIRRIALEERQREQLAVSEAIAERMRRKISDQLAEGGWEEAFNAFLTDLVTFPCAFLKGPILRRQRTIQYQPGPDGRLQVVAGEEIKPEFDRVDPYDIYPEPGITNIEDGYMIERHMMSRSQVSDLIGVPHYDEQAIRSILNRGPGQIRSSYYYHYFEKERLERKDNIEYRPAGMFDALEFWGKVSGKMLAEWGVQEEVDPAREYDANVWLISDTVVKAVLNYDPLGEKPYVKCSFIKQPGAFWGQSLPETIKDIQRVCNAAMRSLVNNMGIASGPQVEVNIDRIPISQKITNIFPWKVWQVNQDPFGTNAPAIRFEQPADNSKNLMDVYQNFSRLADDHSGIPAYIYGDLDVQGAGRTASGLSMLMGSAGKGIRQVVMHIDHDVLKPVIRRMFLHNMRFDEDESIKGDLHVVPKGAVNIMAGEHLNVRRLEFLERTANPVDSQITGIEGRTALLREIAKGLELPADEIIPSRDRERILAMAPPPPPGPGGPGGDPAGGQNPNGSQPAPQGLDPAGNTAGGKDSNLVQ